jgi:hypothetical protein
MTPERESVKDNLALAQRSRRQGTTGLAAATAGAALGERGWLTTILRPAGPLDQSGIRRLAEALSALAASSDIVVVNLTAAEVGSPRALARYLRAPALRFELAGRCLLLIGASPGLTAELDRAAVPVVTLADDALPLSLRPARHDA